MKRDRVFVCEKVKIKGKEYYLYCDSVEITYCEETDPYDIGADNVVIDIKEIEFEDEDVYVKDVETKEIFYFGDSIFDKDTWEDLAVWVNDYVEEGDFEYKYL